jgi:hypothetical protein
LLIQKEQGFGGPASWRCPEEEALSTIFKQGSGLHGQVDFMQNNNPMNIAQPMALYLSLWQFLSAI